MAFPQLLATLSQLWKLWGMKRLYLWISIKVGSLQKKQRFHIREAPSAENALFAPRSVMINIKLLDKLSNCSKNGHNEERCLQKYPSLRLKSFQNLNNSRNGQQTAFIDSQKNDFDKATAICLLSKNVVSCEQPITFCPPSTCMKIASNLSWFLGLHASAHTTFVKRAFIIYYD